MGDMKGLWLPGKDQGLLNETSHAERHMARPSLPSFCAPGWLPGLKNDRANITGLSVCLFVCLFWIEVILLSDSLFLSQTWIGLYCMGGKG